MLAFLGCAGGRDDSDAESVASASSSESFAAPCPPATREGGRDAVDGTGLLRIPGAAENVMHDHEQLMKHPEPPVHPSVDLRRFIRAGDIINYNGSNAWGHAVAVLCSPYAKKVAALHEANYVLARPAVVFAVRVAESASNLDSIGIQTHCLAVHPHTGFVCGVKLHGNSATVSLGQNGPVEAQVLLSPLRTDTTDFPLFYLAIADLKNAQQDLKWSMQTAVRSYLRKATLRAGKYSGARGKQKLATQMGERWRARPICSSVPVRLWQIYLLKRSYGQRFELPPKNLAGAPFKRGRGSSDHLMYCGRQLQLGAKEEVFICGKGGQGFQCLDCLRGQWALPSDAYDEDVAWAEDVLRLMPVKDDRVLPGELLKILLGTGLWEQLSLARGPPLHRLNDAPGPNKTVPVPKKRERLPQGARNEDDADVFLGRDGYTVYCGRDVGRAKSVGARVGQRVLWNPEQEFEWDGTCGPDNGPQCQACSRFQYRLPGILN